MKQANKQSKQTKSVRKKERKKRKKRKAEKLVWNNRVRVRVLVLKIANGSASASPLRFKNLIASAPASLHNCRDHRIRLQIRLRLRISAHSFGYRWCESVTALQGFLDRPTWEQLVEKRVASFKKRIFDSGGKWPRRRASLLLIDCTLSFVNFGCPVYTICVNTLFRCDKAPL